MSQSKERGLSENMRQVETGFGERERMMNEYGRISEFRFAFCLEVDPFRQLGLVLHDMEERVAAGSDKHLMEIQLFCLGLTSFFPVLRFRFSPSTISQPRCLCPSLSSFPPLTTISMYACGSLAIGYC